MEFYQASLVRHRNFFGVSRGSIFWTNNRVDSRWFGFCCRLFRSGRSGAENEVGAQVQGPEPEPEAFAGALS